jgi:hypothetical protein
MNRSASTCVVLLGAALGYWLLLGRAHLAEIADRRTEMADAYERFEAAERESTQEAVLLECAARLERCRTELAPRLALDPGLPFSLRATTELRAHGVTVESSETMAPEPALTRPNHRVRVVVSGTLGRVFAALCALENSPSPTRVTDFALQATDAHRVRGELTIVRAGSEPR